MAIEEKEEQTTSLSELIEIIEKDPIPTNEFTIEDKDPMVILGKLNEVIAYLKSLQATINSSDNKANQALENALKALTSASESLQASTTALNSSNKALETSNLAIDTANTSLEGSNQAKTASNEAIAKANNALQIAQEALNQVTESLGSKVYDNNGNLMNNVKFAGDNGINVDLGEDNQTFKVRLDETITKAIEDNHTAIEQTKAQAQANKEDIANLSEMVADNTESCAIAHDRLTNVETNLTEINPKVARALLTPMTAPSDPFELVGVDKTNSQVMLKLGNGFALTNGDTIIINMTKILPTITTETDAYVDRGSMSDTIFIKTPKFNGGTLYEFSCMLKLSLSSYQTIKLTLPSEMRNIPTANIAVTGAGGGNWKNWERVNAFTITKHLGYVNVGIADDGGGEHIMNVTIKGFTEE